MSKTPLLGEKSKASVPAKDDRRNPSSAIWIYRKYLKYRKYGLTKPASYNPTDAGSWALARAASLIPHATSHRA